MRNPKPWHVVIAELAGEIFMLNGTKQRWVVHDVTLGGDLVLTPYRLNCSAMRFHSHNQKVVTQEELSKNYKIQAAYEAGVKKGREAR